MKKASLIHILSYGLSILTASAAPWMGALRLSDPRVWPTGRPGNYGTAKYYLDEDRRETIPVTFTVEVYADGAPPDRVQVQLYSNLNRRDQAVPHENPPVNTSAPGAHWQTYTMTYDGPAGANHRYRIALNINKCGAYRATARFRINSGAWQWHSQFEAGGLAQRDMAIVVSPKKVLDLSIYEANPLTVEATPGGRFENRSTFEDFTDRDRDGFDPFNLSYVRRTLGFNTLWLMPIHPIGQSRWYPASSSSPLNLDGSLGAGFSPGSPYATRNYWEVNEWLADGNNWAAARDEFVRLVNQAEDMGLNVFLDVAMNHAGWDVMYGRGAVELGYCAPGEEFDLVRNRRPGWCTRGSDWLSGRYYYREPATEGWMAAAWAPADQMPRHQWFDAGVDWFFGNYSSLGLGGGYGYADGIGGYLDERDLFWTWVDGSPLWVRQEVERVWNYFAHYVPYWLRVTGGKLDGIRADFAQGLPPQAWEYIINKTRQVKWDFIFLAEVLDDDPVRYRANRHFDLMTTVRHDLFRKPDVTMRELADLLEGEAAAYGYNAAVLHNGSSHDENPDALDPWIALARYAVSAALHGAPMAYQGQPLGVPHKINFETEWANMHWYWLNRNDPARNEMYRRIHTAREERPALRSTHRYFLNRKFGGGFNNQIFACARWQSDSGETPLSVIIAAVNLRQHGVGAETYSLPDEVPLVGTSSHYGYTAYYQAFNLVADDPDVPLWPAPRTAAEIRRDGLTVVLNTANEIQYIELRVIDCVAEELARRESRLYAPRSSFTGSLAGLRRVRDLMAETKLGRSTIAQYEACSGEVYALLTKKGNESLATDALYLMQKAGLAAWAYFKNPQASSKSTLTDQDWALGRLFLRKLYYQTPNPRLRSLLLDLNKKSSGAEGRTYEELLRIVR